MNGIINKWSALAARQKLMMIAGLVAFGAVFALVARLAFSPNYALLYAGLENGAAGDVVAVLEQRNVPYQIKGDSIFVSSDQKDQLRMTLAADGLPKTGTQGYEILDNLSGFGTTSQMFDAAYWRAKEGELARTISAHPNILSARVHISNDSNVLTRTANPVKASVALTTSNGLSAQHAKALRYLVSSAISGLSTDNVAIIDDENGLISEADTNGSLASIDQRADVLKKRIERLLEARVGYGSAIVEVNIEADLDQESITERRFDPAGRVAVSMQSVETTKASTDTGSTPVGVASNVPDGQTSNGSGGSQSNDSETRETINYEVSETQRELVKAPGAIKKLSVAVLIDRQDLITSDTMTEETELAALQELVSSAVGIDVARGDSLTIKTLDFKPLVSTTPEVASSLWSAQPIDPMKVAQLIALVIVALITALFVIRPLLMSSRQSSPGPESPLLETDIRQISAMDGETSPDQTTQKLRAMIGEKQDETIDILKSWLDDSRETSA